jgi:peptidyl-dipeptidase Dcp
MFWVAGRLFGLSFQPLPEAPVYHPDVRAFQAVDRAGAPVGLIYFDPFARPGKASGAWMAQVRSQERLDGPVLPVVTNCANLVKAPPGEPTLLGWDDASMLFHEFGHALHGLLSQVELPALSGTSVALDYVEFPSQILERWLQVPEVLQRFAVHAGTGAPIPAALVGRLVAAARYNQGFAVVEYLASALVDMKLHLSGGEVDPAAFERQTLAELGMPGEMAMRHRLPQFGHLFSRDDYSAGYYAYLWAETLSADGYAAFAEAGDPFDAEVAARLGRLLSLGNTVDPAEAYRGYRGKDPGIEPYLRWRGLA